MFCSDTCYDKTKLVVFGSRQLLAKLPYFKISLLGKDLALTSSAKDLGVVLDPQLTFDDHVLKTTSSCMSSLAQISRVKHVLDRNQLVTVINALVFSKLLYCSTVWSNTSNKNICRLQSVQNFAARIITGTRKFDHITPALRDLRWFPIKSCSSATLSWHLNVWLVKLHITSAINLQQEFRSPGAWLEVANY